MLTEANTSVARVRGDVAPATSLVTTARVTAEDAANARPLTPAANAVRSGATGGIGRQRR